MECKCYGIQWHVHCTAQKKKKSHTQTCRTTASFDDGTFSPYLFSCRVSIILRVLMMGESYCCVKSSPSERFRVGLTSRLCRGQCEYDPLSSLFRESLFHNLSPLNPSSVTLEYVYAFPLNMYMSGHSVYLGCQLTLCFKHKTLLNLDLQFNRGHLPHLRR